eukprot:TRINITY_DN16066_c0_g2_i2.p1 TRINITY_DN16066_c0_g2~~TRINITY_DN16066_c0_g2_i2.p1  ORF type:complete len:584 (+),score=168.65 TRINITY_DN16066_c0_g2_i2:294-2045(+)
MPSEIPPQLPRISGSSGGSSSFSSTHQRPPRTPSLHRTRLPAHSDPFPRADTAPTPTSPVPVSEYAHFRPVSMGLSESERALSDTECIWPADSPPFRTPSAPVRGGSGRQPIPVGGAPRSSSPHPGRGRSDPVINSDSTRAETATRGSLSSASSHAHSGQGEDDDSAGLRRINSVESNSDDEPLAQRPLERKVSFGGVAVHFIDPALRPLNEMTIGGQTWSYRELVAAMRGQRAPALTRLPIQDHSCRLRTYHNSFRGDELLVWLLKNTRLRTREEATRAASTLVSGHVVERCDHSDRPFTGTDELYRLWEDSRRLHGGRQHHHVLNGSIAWVGGARPPLDIVDDLLYTLMEHYSRERQSAGRSPPVFPEKRFQERAAELQTCDLGLLKDAGERTAFFLNLYHTLALHARTIHGVEERALREAFFNKLCYNVGGEFFCLNDIEYGVLRGNCSSSVTASKRFGKADSRCRWSRGPVRPEAFFAVSHLCSDSVPVQAYGKEGLDAQLDGACAETLRRTVRVMSDGIRLPSSCKRVRCELGEDGLAAFVQRHISPDQRQAMQRCRVPRMVCADCDWHAARPVVCPV